MSPISIHALREEGDLFRRPLGCPHSGFLSTPSARRATGHALFLRVKAPISIHALREEGDNKCGFCQVRKTEFLSTPSARRATTGICPSSFFSIFLSTPSARRATPFTSGSDNGYSISIHALREEGDLNAAQPTGRAWNFYPRPPRGGRPAWATSPASALTFLSTPSARRATNSNLIAERVA